MVLCEKVISRENKGGFYEDIHKNLARLGRMFS